MVVVHSESGGVGPVEDPNRKKPLGDVRMDALSSPIAKPERRFLSVDEMVDLVLERESMPSELQDHKFRYGAGYSTYINARFPNHGSLQVSLHIGPGPSFLPMVDALNGCRVIIAEPAHIAYESQDNRFHHEIFSRRFRDQVNAAGGDAVVKRMGCVRILKELSDSKVDVDHITVRNVFNFGPTDIPDGQFYYDGNPEEDIKGLLKAIKSGGTILVDKMLTYKQDPYQFRYSGETFLRNAVGEIPGSKLVELAELRLPSTGPNANEVDKLFMIHKT